MQKGVTVEQVARVARAFTDAGVMVHAYLMYGFPTETEQETIDALERVRQLFDAGCIQSAFWHRFAATAHSPIGLAPKRFGIRLLPTTPADFARNELPFEDPTGTDHDFLGRGLRKALYNYMHGVGLELDVRSWFTDGEREQCRPRAPLVHSTADRAPVRRRVPTPKVAARSDRERARAGRAVHLDTMPIKPWFPTFIYDAPLQPRGRTPPSRRSLLDDCHKVRDHDRAGQRWCRKNYPGGYTSYASLYHLHRTFSTFMDAREEDPPSRAPVRPPPGHEPRQRHASR